MALTSRPAVLNRHPASTAELTLFPPPAFHFRLQFHGADITGLQFSADSAELVSVSMDASVCVWDAATGAYALAHFAVTPATRLQYRAAPCGAAQAGSLVWQPVQPHLPPTCLASPPPATCHAGMPTGLFVGDCGFTCCWLDGVLDQLAVGTDRGIVHALDLGVAPRGMAGAPLAGPAHVTAIPAVPAALPPAHALAAGCYQQALPGAWAAGVPPPPPQVPAAAPAGPEQHMTPPATTQLHQQQPQQQFQQQQPTAAAAGRRSCDGS